MSAVNFEQILTSIRHQRQVEAIAKKNIRGTSIHWEDAAQIVHLKLLEVVRAGRFREGSEEQFYRWAASVAKHTIIDFVRKELRHERNRRLDKSIAGTELKLLDTVPSPVDEMDTLESTNLTHKILDALVQLDHSHPGKHYRQIVCGLANGQTQTKLAKELGITQSAISKRLKELPKLMDGILQLGIFSAQTVGQTNQNLRKSKTLRQRSDEQW
jgi:RNA polymerase sigma factor (sigma-70 family)